MLIDSHKKVSLSVFALFFLLDAVLIFLFHERAVTEFVCTLVGQLVLPLILFSFVVGFICFLFSAFGIRVTAMKNLTTLEDNIKPFRQTTDRPVDAKEVLGKCADKVKELDKEQGFEWRGLNTAPRHLYNRLRALGVERGQEMRNAERGEVSGLQDLHELTMQSELSRTCSSGMNTIISFLLILGILGTLTGVHGVIRTGVKDVSDLAPALEPSQWAVGFTVILLMLRGMYLRMVDRYIYRLDKLTMDCLRPALSPGKTKDAESEQALQDMEQTLRTLGSHSRNPMTVTAFADFARLAEDLKKALAAGADDLRIGLGRPLPPEVPAPDSKKSAKGINAAQRKPKKPKSKGNANVEQEKQPVPTEMPTTTADTQGNQKAPHREASAAEKDEKTPKKKQRPPVKWDTAAVAEQVETMAAGTSDAVVSLTQWENEKTEGEEQAEADRALIRAVLQQMHRNLPKEADVKSVQAHFHKRIASAQDMDQILARLTVGEAQHQRRYAPTIGAVSAQNNTNKGRKR